MGRVTGRQISWAGRTRQGARKERRGTDGAAAEGGGSRREERSGRQGWDLLLQQYQGSAPSVEIGSSGGPQPEAGLKNSAGLRPRRVNAVSEPRQCGRLFGSARPEPRHERTADGRSAPGRRLRDHGARVTPPPVRVRTRGAIRNRDRGMGHAGACSRADPKDPLDSFAPRAARRQSRKESLEPTRNLLRTTACGACAQGGMIPASTLPDGRAASGCSPRASRGPARRGRRPWPPRCLCGVSSAARRWSCGRVPMGAEGPGAPVASGALAG